MAFDRIKGDTMKKLLLRTAALGAAILSPCTQARELELDDQKFDISVYRKTGPRDAMNRIYTEKIRVKPGGRISKDAASQIHATMEKFYQSLFAQGKTCRPDPQGGAWAYEAEFDEALMAFRTMSIVFNVTSACAGNHVFDKVGWTFDISTGKQLPPIALINRYVPSLRKAGVRTNGNFLQLNKDAVALVMSNLKPEIKTACLDYFERSNYGVWLDEEGDVVFSPVFDYRYVNCAGRYYMAAEK
jgi:hypothetical protein